MLLVFAGGFAKHGGELIGRHGAADSDRPMPSRQNHDFDSVFV
jgi:hypothetical protein